jgi:hypothetical protein
MKQYLHQIISLANCNTIPYLNLGNAGHKKGIFTLAIGLEVESVGNLLKSVRNFYIILDWIGLDWIGLDRV